MGRMKEHMKERATNTDNISVHPPLPRSLNVELNNTCNQKCIFCPEHGPYAKRNMKPCVMKKSLAQKILFEARKKGIGEKEVGFYINGEAFLYKDLPEMIAYAKELGFQYTFLTTNGALGTPERMKAVVNAGLDSIRFSVNAGDRETYCWLHGKDDFDVVLSNMRYLHQYRAETGRDLGISLSCVVTKKTTDQIEKVRQVFGSLVDEILFIPVANLSMVDDGLDHELSLPQSIYANTAKPMQICPLIFNSMYIEASGEVDLCCNPIGEHIKAGVISEEKIDFEEIWYGPVFQHYREAFLSGRLCNTVCSECSMLKNGAGQIDLEGVL